MAFLKTLALVLAFSTAISCATAPTSDIGPTAPKFACTCSRDRVGAMIRSLGTDEVEGILAERNEVEVACEFCGKQYRFDAVDAAQLFTTPDASLPGPSAVQ